MRRVDEIVRQRLGHVVRQIEVLGRHDHVVVAEEVVQETFKAELPWKERMYGSKDRSEHLSFYTKEIHSYSSFSLYDRTAQPSSSTFFSQRSRSTRAETKPRRALQSPRRFLSPPGTPRRWECFTRTNRRWEEYNIQTSTTTLPNQHRIGSRLVAILQ